MNSMMNKNMGGGVRPLWFWKSWRPPEQKEIFFSLYPTCVNTNALTWNVSSTFEIMARKLHRKNMMTTTINIMVKPCWSFSSWRCLKYLKTNKQNFGVCTLLKTGKFKGCVTIELLIVGSTRHVASIFKLKSIEGVELGTREVFWGCGNGNCAAYLEFSIPFSLYFSFFNRVVWRNSSYSFGLQMNVG